MSDLKTKADLQTLVDNKVEESLTLDYKAAPALSKPKADEISKDVSSFANSAGGRLIYGIEEDRKARLPAKLDEGVSHADMQPEWLEQTLNSRIQPRIQGLVITRIPFEADGSRSGYVIDVPQSLIGPHQAPDNKYYKRYNFQSVPMEDYEVKDVIRRSSAPNLRMKWVTGARLTISPHEEVSAPHPISFYVRNSSPTPAYYTAAGIVLDRRLNVLLTGGYEPQDERVLGGDRCLVFSKAVGIPQQFPIFRERDFELGGVNVRVPLGREDSFRIGWELATPGNRSSRTGTLFRNASNVSLLWDDGDDEW